MSDETLQLNSMRELPGHGLARLGAPAFWLPAAVGLAYYAGCIAGFALRFPGSGISFFWPPTAILTAAMLLAGPRSWPGFLVGSLVAHGLAHSADGIGVSAWLVLFVGNASQAILAAAIVRQFSAGTEIFTGWRRIVAFVLGACLVAPAVASLLPSLIYVSLGWATDFLIAWRTRTVSNATAMLTIVPSLVMMWPILRARRIPAHGRLAEFVVLLATLALVHFWQLPATHREGLRLVIALYAPMPLLLWAAVRFGVAGVSFALAGTTLLTVGSSLSGYGPLTGDAASDSVLAVQLTIIASAVPMLLLAGVLEHHRVEHHALVDIEQQHGAILRALPDRLFLLARDGRCLRSYPPTPGKQAHPRLPLDGEHVQDVLPADAGRAFRRMVASIGADESSVLEYTATVGGAPVRLEARFTAVDAERVLMVTRDITTRWRSEEELRESQRRYALATAAGGIGVWELRVDTAIVRIDGNLKQILGYGADETGDRLEDWLALIEPRDLDDVLSQLNALLERKIKQYDVQFRIRHRDGSMRWLAVMGALTAEHEHAPVKVAGTYADVTERHENAQLLREANEAVVRMNRIAAMAEVSASITHELSQPLTAIAAAAMTGLRWTESDGTGRRLHELFRNVLEDSRRAGHVIERTHRMFSNEPAETGDVNLNDVVRTTLDVVGPRLLEAGIQLYLALDDELSAVRGDAVQLQQVLMNLVVNAIAAMRETAGQPRLLSIRTLRSKRHVVVTVRDSGPGFDHEAAAHLFDAFYTTKSDGTGMGLAIARSIIQTHGGRLWAAANVDRGVTFRFKLPRTGARAMRLRRLLVVDDDRSVRRSLSRLFRTWGHQVVVASGPARALALAETFRPDMAIVDLSLGDGTGLDLARTLRARFADRKCQLVAMSAEHDETVQQACLEVFDGYVVKSGRLAELERLLA